MPESKVRKGAKENLKRKREAEAIERGDTVDRRIGESVPEHSYGASRNWVPWVFIPLGLLGVLWMVVYQLAGNSIGFMRALGDWNVLVGLGLIIASFTLMTLWK